MVADNREVTLYTIQSAERLQYGNHISYQQALRVCERLREEIEGDEGDMFMKIPALWERIALQDVL